MLTDARTDCPVGLVYLVADDGRSVELAASYGTAAEVDLAARPIPAQGAEVIATGAMVSATDLATRLPGFTRGGASPAGNADLDTAFVLPLTAAGRPRPAQSAGTPTGWPPCSPISCWTMLPTTTSPSCSTAAAAELYRTGGRADRSVPPTWAPWPTVPGSGRR